MKHAKKIFYDNDLPFNSFDRIFALYLIDQHFDIVEKFDVEKAKVSKEYCEKYFKENIEQNDYLSKEWENNNNRAYNNYEREGISDIEAFANMLYVAKKGPDAVLENNCYNCEWFGAS